MQVAPGTHFCPVEIMPAYMSASAARRHFKQTLGNANHLIITAMAGLDAIERGIVTTIPDDLHAAWSPKDPVASARRSRRLLLDMALVRAVDALDVYIRHSNRKPFLIQSPHLRAEIDKAGLSIFKAFIAIEKHYSAIDHVLSSLVALMITWRNRAAHSESDNEVQSYHKEIIKINSSDIASRFRGLNAEHLLSGYEAYRAPGFKEIASFINATHHYVEGLERAQFASLRMETFLKELVWTALSDNARKGETGDHARRRRAKSVWGKDATERRKHVERFLQHQGLSFVKHADRFVTFDDDLLNSLTAKTPSEVLAWATAT